MLNRCSRRDLFAATGAAVIVAAAPFPALALTRKEAEALVDQMVGDITRVINSGKPEAQMLKDFENIFIRYSDIPIIARSVLGADGRSASARQKKAFEKAFRGYIARKYGKRFRKFEGGKIEVRQSRKTKSGNVEVKTMAFLKGEAPFEIVFSVSGKSGKNKFYNLTIEGVSMLQAERTEIGAMLDNRKGDIDRLTADLKKAG